MRYLPLGTRVLIRPAEPLLETSYGIILAPSDPGPDVHGVVISVGEKVVDLSPGDEVIFSGVVGQLVQLDDRRVLIMDEADVSAIVTADPEACPYCDRPLEAAHAG